MAEVRTLIIKVKDGELDELKGKLKGVDVGFDEVEKGTGKVSKGLKGIKDNGGAIATLDALTGGAATRIRDAAEATNLFNLNLKATRAAIIATGIGALVVALGLIVAYWDDIVEFITQANKNLEEQISLLKAKDALLSAEFSALEAQEKLLIQQGKSTDDLIEKKKLLLQQQIGIAGAELASLKLQQERLINQSKELTFWEKIRDAALIVRGMGGLGGRQTNEEQTAITAGQQAIAELEARIANLQTTLDVVINGERQDPEAVRGANQDKAQTLPTTGVTLDELSTLGQQEFDALALQNTARNRLEEENAAYRIKIAEEEFKAKQLLLDATAQGLSAASDILGRETAAGKGLAVAGALISTYAAIAGQLKAFAGVPVPGYAIAQAVATGLAGFAAVKNILAVQVPGGQGGGSVPGGQPAAPAFNVVESSGQNQLNQSLLEQKRSTD